MDKELEKKDKGENAIALSRSRAIIPALEALASEIEQRAESGQLAKELKTMKAGSLIHNLSKILAAIKQNAVMVQVNNKTVAEEKDPSWFRANSASELTERQRERMRKEAIDAEVEKPND